MYSFEAVNRTKLPYDVNYSQKLMTKSLNPFNASCSKVLMFKGFRAILV